MKIKWHYLNGRRFGKLQVDKVIKKVGKQTMCICTCDCGKEIGVSLIKLIKSKKRNCGCEK